MDFMSDTDNDLAERIAQRRTEENSWRKDLSKEADKKRSAWLELVAERSD